MRTDLAETTPTLPSLTGLRWIAALLVFCLHLVIVGYFAQPAGSLVETLFSAGETGVSLFFALSGFVLVWSYRPGVSAVGFWRRRLARIWPLHLVGVGLAVLVAATLVPVIRTADPGQLVANLLLVNTWRSDWWQAGNPVSWSLACEAFFYLLFPLIYRVLRPVGRDGLAIVAVCAVACVWLGPAVAAWAGVSALSFPPLRLPEFVLGVVVGLLVRFGGWRGARMLPALAVAAAGYVAASVFHDSDHAVAGFTIVGFALLLSALARADVEGRPTLTARRGVVRLGEISFSFYLVHLLVVGALGGLWEGGHPELAFAPAVGLSLVALAGAVGLAWTLNRAVEIPGRRLILLSPRRLLDVRAPGDAVRRWAGVLAPARTAPSEELRRR